MYYHFIQTWPKEEVNWSQKAREYRIRRSFDDSTMKNGGQVVKDYLIAHGVDVSHFEKETQHCYPALANQFTKPNTIKTLNDTNSMRKR